MIVGIFGGEDKNMQQQEQSYFKSPFLFGLKERVEDYQYKTTEQLDTDVGGNTGNLAFHYAIKQHISTDVNVGWYDAPEKINRFGDVGVMACANQIGAHADCGGLADRLKNITVPVLSIGLGAQSSFDGKIPEVPEGSVRWLEEIVAKSATGAPNIAVRGPFTGKVLEHYGFGGKFEVLGCPTLFISKSPTLGQDIVKNFKAPKTIAVASGHYRWNHLAKIESSLANMVSVTNGSYIGQSPLEMIKLTRREVGLISQETIDSCRDYACPHMTSQEFSDWIMRYGNVFFDVPSWMEHYRKYDFVVGLRIHGVMLALQMGIPAVCIVHDSRTLELCETMKVPFLAARDIQQGVSRQKIVAAFEQFDPNEFDKNRVALCEKYVAFLRQNRVQPDQSLLNIIKVTG
jgi:hypothetical protein